jgi:hypothetical protein
MGFIGFSGPARSGSEEAFQASVSIEPQILSHGMMVYHQKLRNGRDGDSVGMGKDTKGAVPLLERTVPNPLKQGRNVFRNGAALGPLQYHVALRPALEHPEHPLLRQRRGLARRSRRRQPSHEIPEDSVSTLITDGFD